MTYTLRSERWRQHTGAMLLYFAGMLTMAWVLQARSFFFVAFTIVGFLQSFMVVSAPLGFLVVAATSVVVYTASGGFPKPTVEAWSGYIFIVALQTLLTGFFSFVGAKLSKEHKQRQQLVADLEAALEENAGLHAQLLAQAREAGVLDERARMAREIHDTLAQGLTGIITQLEAAERARHLPEQLSRHMDQARSLARESLTEARRSVQALQPEPLEGSQLPEAIASMAKRWSETSTVALSLDTTGEPKPILAELEATLFRVAQEALTNVSKHANASKVGLTLSYMDDEVLLDVRDDGVGFDVGSLDGNATGGLRPARDAAALAARRWQPGGRERPWRRHRHQRQRPGDPGGGRRMSAAGQPIRLLIVDDHPVVRDGLRGVFTGDPDFEVVGEASDGAEAVATVERLGADVVLMDLRMPRMGGVEAISRLRASTPSARVLVLTTYDTDKDVLPAIEAGATGYLLKDAPREELVRAVRAAARGESVLSPAVASRLMGQVRKPAREALSTRELDVLKLFVSEATIKTHLLHIYDKLGVRDRAGAVGEAYKRRLLP